MTLAETMKALEAAGTAQNRKVYARHGYPANMFGVSWAELGKLQKKIKRDQPLSGELWETGNGDAMILATMIADPAAVTMKQLEAWAGGLASYAHSDALARLVAQTPHAGKLIAKWTKSKTDLVSQCGWSLVAHRAGIEEAFDEAELAAMLAKIEQGIHAAPNWTRRAMNGALIAIGLRSAKLEKLAIAAAGRIGKVEVDHGETSCQTPDAADYIRKAAARRKKKS
ncbi:MAG: DNA alkylation repair protein [Bryobacteraceae bacterium]|nr:DNA alkylation repair protein [Bryobacteraceae bacterium]